MQKDIKTITFNKGRKKMFACKGYWKDGSKRQNQVDEINCYAKKEVSQYQDHDFYDLYEICSVRNF